MCVVNAKCLVVKKQILSKLECFRILHRALLMIKAKYGFYAIKVIVYLLVNQLKWLSKSRRPIE